MRETTSGVHPLFTVVGLTGGIASGKSTVSRMLADLDVAIVDADLLARQVVALGTPGLAQVAETFGHEMLLADGTLDRKALGSVVFGNPAQLVRLESILHPRITAAAAAAISAHREAGEPFVVYDAALLVEWGIAADFDPLVVVAVPAEVQVARIVARDGMSADEARLRLAVQLPLADKVAAADVVIDNAGSLDDTQTQVAALVARLRARAYPPEEES
jgi:dephospho-CoA kinase